MNGKSGLARFASGCIGVLLGVLVGIILGLLVGVGLALVLGIV